MNYRDTIYRPPVEASTFLLPVTEGCTHNSCAFCSMYRDVPFNVIGLADIEGYLREVVEEYGEYAGRIDRVYLVGANPFALTAAKLLERIDLVRRYLPNVRTFTMYARVDDVARKSDEDLLRLREAGVNDLYLGLESGLDDVLSSLNKGFSLADSREQALRLNMAGIDHSDLLMLGTAGSGRGLEAARAAAELENEVRPTQILVNTMSAFAGTPLDEDVHAGRFVLASERENLEEELALLDGLDLPDSTYFWAAHPLDAVSVRGTLGADRSWMRARLATAIEGGADRDVVRVSRRGTL